MGRTPAPVKGRGTEHAKPRSNDLTSGRATVEPAPRAARPGVEPIRAAALEAFAERGFAAASMRDIAERAGVSMAAIYYHYRAKSDLLLELTHGVMHQLIAATEAERDAADPTPAARFAAVVRAHARFHAVHRHESFVGNTELRSLGAEDRRTLIGLRDTQQQLFDDEVRAGCADGSFTTPHPREASRAAVTMTTAIATWYGPDGDLTPDEVAARYVTLALDLVGADDASRPRAS